MDKSKKQSKKQSKAVESSRKQSENDTVKRRNKKHGAREMYVFGAAQTNACIFSKRYNR